MTSHPDKPYPILIGSQEIYRGRVINVRVDEIEIENGRNVRRDTSTDLLLKQALQEVDKRTFLDRITPVAHARKLAAHFGSPLVSWHGGHLLQLGRNAAFRRVETLIRELRAPSR